MRCGTAGERHHVEHAEIGQRRQDHQMARSCCAGGYSYSSPWSPPVTAPSDQPPVTAAYALLNSWVCSSVSGAQAFSLSSVSLRRVDQRVAGQFGIDLVQLVGHIAEHGHVPGRIDRLGVVGPVVDVVDPLLGGLLVLGGVRGITMVSTKKCSGIPAPRTAGQGLSLKLQPIARICLGDNDIAGRKVVGVVVAGEPADLCPSAP